MEGAVDLVQLLFSRGCPMAVASSAPRERIELSLSVTGLLQFFTGRVASSYEVGSWKPAPGVLLHAAQIMGVTAAECVVVEDSLPGIHAGLAAGMAVFAFQPRSIDSRIPSDVTILKKLDELAAFLP